MSEEKNLILAVALCVVVILGWQVLFPTPTPQPQPGAGGQAQTAAPEHGAGTDKLAVEPELSGGTAPSRGAAALTRQQALAETRRIRIDAPKVDGSISLDGGLIDDIQLKDYRETVDPDSPEITLLNPRGTAKAYYSSFGWIQTGGDKTRLPDAKTPWTAAGSGPLTPDHPVTLTWDNGQGMRFTRTFAIDDNYMFTVTDAVENYGAANVELQPFGQVARFGRSPGRPYFVVHEGLIGEFNGTLSELTYKNAEKGAEGAPQKVVEQQESTGGWLGITDKYWLTALVPDQTRQFTGRYKYYAPEGTSSEIFAANFVMKPETVAPGASATVTSHFFSGAKKLSILSDYQKNLGIDHFDMAIDWGWFFFLTRPYFWALHHLDILIGNLGVAILVLTVLIKALFFPLANQSYASMSKMKKIQPEMVKLRERYADDKVKQNQEIMELYKREKVNPMAGCLPMLIQIPVFFALYKTLFVTIEMRQAPFFGWIHDLSVPDPTTIFNLFGLIPWTPPAFLPMLGVWPLIMGMTMLVQQRLNPPPADPMQEKIFLFMPIMFTFILASFPAGLVIYWAWNNTLSVLQQYVIMRRMGVEVDLLGRLKLTSVLKLIARARKGGTPAAGSGKTPAKAARTASGPTGAQAKSSSQNPVSSKNGDASETSAGRTEAAKGADPSNDGGEPEAASGASAGEGAKRPAE